MSTANGNPVFVTVSGNASAATATYIPSGAKASQTDTLATVALNANMAATNATAANETANAAKAAVSGALNGAVLKVDLGQPYGAFPLDQYGLPYALAVQPGNFYMSLGANGSAGSGAVTIQVASANGVGAATYTNNIWDSAFIFWGGTVGTANKGNLSFRGASLIPDSATPCSLGSANNAWSGIVSQSAVQVISDNNDKNIVGTIGDSVYVDQTTKLRAAWLAISGVVYTLKASTNTDPRNHIGVIAQTVQAAFTAQGLDPSDWGLWCETPKTQMVETPVTDATTGKVTTTMTVEPVYEADGKTQATQQTIRYEELLSLGIFCERLERADLAARVTALEAKTPSTSATPAA